MPYYPLFSDEYFMNEALKEAKKAAEMEEVPVGAVVVSDNRIIARGHNMVEKMNDVTAHAEMIALTAAFEYLDSKYLPDCILYVTIEPCAMCAGAIAWSKVSKLVYGATDIKFGYSKFSDIIHEKVIVTKGVLENECAGLMKEFFKKKRKTSTN